MSNSKAMVSTASGKTVTVGGGSAFFVIAGPCSIDSGVRFRRSAEFLKSCGADALRGAVHKMRTSPAGFQGMGREGYPVLKDVRESTDLPVFTEIVDVRQIDELEPVVDCYQVGARSMYNYELLKELGRQKKPVLLKRAFSAHLDEWSGALEYVLRGGNSNVILCERGVRGFDPNTRNILDLSAVVLMKRRTGLPVLVDPSHGTGRRDLVVPLSLAALAVGADGIIVEVHPDPTEALSDAEQAITENEFIDLMTKIKRLQSVTREFNSVRI